MIIFEKRGDIFRSACQTLVCPVNTQGVMGAGLALAFNRKFPGLLGAYRRACRADVFKREGYFVWAAPDGQLVLCFPSKQRWRDPSKLSWIDTALWKISKTYQDHGIVSVAFPAVGCGLGELEWEDVRSLIYQHLDGLELEVGLYAP